MADEKFSDEIKKELKGFNETVSKNTKKFGKSMAAVINKMAEVNAPLAAQLSDVRAASKDSFAAALQTKKAAELTARLSDVQSSNLIISNKELGELNEIFKKYGAESFDVKGFSQMQKKLNKTSEELEDLENKYQIELEKRKKSTAILGKMEADIAKQEELMNNDRFAKGAVYQDALKKRDELQTSMEAKEKQLMTKESEAIEAKKKQYDEEKKQADEFNQIINDVNATLQEDGGRFGQFSDGIKTLTGIDIQDYADDVVKNVNALGKVFGQENLFGSMFESLQSLGPKLSESFSEGFSSLSGVGKDIGNFLKDGLSSAFDGIGSMIGDALGGIASAWILATGKISAGFTWVTGKLQLGMDMLMASSVGTFLKSMKKLAGRFLMLGKRLLMGAATMVANALIFIGGLMMTAASLFVAALPFIAIGVLIIGAIVGLVMAFNYMYENVEWFRNGIDWIAEKFWQVYQFLADMGVFDAIKTYIGDIFSSITGIFTGVIDFVKAAMSGDFGGMWEAVKSIFSSIKDLFLAPFKFVKNLILGEDPEGLDEAQESGLYDLDRIGNSEIDEDKVKGAPMKHLKAIVAHDDLSEDDMALIKEEIARQEAINLAAGAPPTTGQEVALGTQELAGAGAGGGVTVINQVNDNSQSSSSTSVHGGSGKTTNSDSTAGRVANNVE